MGLDSKIQDIPIRNEMHQEETIVNHESLPRTRNQNYERSSDFEKIIQELAIS